MFTPALFRATLDARIKVIRVQRFAVTLFPTNASNDTKKGSVGLLLRGMKNEAPVKPSRFGLGSNSVAFAVRDGSAVIKASIDGQHRTYTSNRVTINRQSGTRTIHSDDLWLEQADRTAQLLVGRCHNS